MKKATREVTLDQWLQEVKQFKGEKAFQELKKKLEEAKKKQATAKVEGAGGPGACLVTNPQTGQGDCVYIDPGSCSAIGGSFIGGPCGSTIEKEGAKGQ
jgi:hypothetical protein